MPIFNRFFSIALVSLSLVATSCGGGNTEEKASTSTLPNFETGYFWDQNPPVPESHASTVLHLPNGELMAAWFAGEKEGTDDVGIWLTKGKHGTWKTPVEVVKIREDAHWNPVLFQSPEGKIFLYFKVGKKIPSWETWVVTSDDNGETWSEATELVKGDKGGRGPVRNKPIITAEGLWLSGASHEEGPWDAFIDISEDKGATWKATPYLKLNRDNFKGKGIIQPTLWESAPGKVHMLIRSSNGAIYRSDSEDGGRSWSEAVPSGLGNPNSGVDLTKLDDGTLVLAYNPDTTDWGSRSPLSLALSFDNGKTWPKILDIDKGDVKDEFSYPAIINYGDTIAVTYTWNRKKIAYWVGTKQDLLNAAKDR